MSSPLYFVPPMLPPTYGPWAWADSATSAAAQTKVFAMLNLIGNHSFSAMKCRTAEAIDISTLPGSC